MFEDFFDRVKQYGRLSYMNGYRDGYREGIYNGVFIGITTSLLAGTCVLYLTKNK